MNTDAPKPFSFKPYFSFKGRESFGDFWWFYAISYATLFIFWLIDDLLNTTIFGWVAVIVFFIPQTAYSIRRLHDTDKRGWWVLVEFIPVVGILVLLYLLIQRGDDGPNRFGPPPSEL